VCACAGLLARCGISDERLSNLFARVRCAGRACRLRLRTLLLNRLSLNIMTDGRRGARGGSVAITAFGVGGNATCSCAGGYQLTISCCAMPVRGVKNEEDFAGIWLARRILRVCRNLFGRCSPNAGAVLAARARL